MSGGGFFAKGQLIYGGSANPGDGDAVASYLHTSTHALTSTNVGGKLALDVNMVNEIAVTVDGVYDGGTNTNPDNVGLIVHQRNAAPGDTHQTIRATGGSPTADGVVAANVFAQDVAAILYGFNGTTFDRITSSSGMLDINIAGTDGVDLDVVGNVADDVADSGNPVKIGFRAIGAALGAVSAGNDRADGITDLYRRQYVTSAPNKGHQHAIVALNDTTETQFDATPLAGRQRVLIENFGAKAIFVGNVGVTASGATRGWKIPAKTSWSDAWGEYLPLYGITESGTFDVLFWEVG